jgi:hypothetical protein
MPQKRTIQRARADKRAGKAPSTQAGEFVREEIDLVREGKRRARSTKQAIAIGLSKARKAGVQLPPKPAAKKRRGVRGGARRSATASRESLSRQTKEVMRARGPAKRRATARKAARTRAHKAR